MGCPQSLPKPLESFLKQDEQNFIFITSNPQSFRERYKKNRMHLIKQKILTIEQLAQNKIVQRMIMSEVEVQQFELAYQYRNNQRKEPFSQHQFGNSGYTFKFENLTTLNNGKNVLVIGESESGKSTLINALGNSLIIDYADRYRYHISEYDYQECIQECDLDVQNVQFKFLEVMGYGQDLQKNKNIMFWIHKYLQEKNINIDCIIICKRYGNNTLSKQEKQIIYHLAEVFGQQYIQKCFFVITKYDQGIKDQIENQLRDELNSINHIYNLMPKPKILFVNSLTNPFEGILGNSRFQTVKDARDSINNLIRNNDNQRISCINLDAFNNRRENENEMRQIKNQINNSLVELLPYLENYFSICQVNEKDDLFYASTVSWSTLQDRKRNKKLSSILDDILLPDDIIKKIEEKQDQPLNSLTIDFDRQKRKIKEATYKEQFIKLRDDLTNQKNNRLTNIDELADNYLEYQQNYLQQTYIHQVEIKEQLITSNMNDQLRQYLQQDQLLEIESLKREFEDIRQKLYLPNVNLLATQIIM